MISRRSFVEAGAFAFIAGPGALREMFERAPVPSQPTILKSRAQYLSEAALFDAGIRDLTAAASISISTAAERLRLTSIVSTAGPKLDFFHSRMIAHCLADTGLMRWVNSELRDSASAKAFIERVKRNPASIDTVPAIAMLRTKLAAIAEQHRRIVQQLAHMERVIAGMEEVQPALAAKAGEAAECQKTWVIVTAIVVAVVSAAIAIVVAVMTSGAAELSQKFAGTGADVAHAALKSSNQRYVDCVRAAETLPSDRRTRALAACQARWLNEKSVYMV